MELLSVCSYNPGVIIELPRFPNIAQATCNIRNEFYAANMNQNVRIRYNARYVDVR